MDRSPERWKNGVVVIRIGLNNWQGLLDVQAQDPNSAQSQAAIDYCSEQIGDAIALIRKSHPTTHILLVGIGNEADDPGNFERWQSVSESANIRSALDRFNGEIRRLAETSPGVAFFDDSAWFRQLWGARDAQGKPDYRTVDVGAGIRVTNTVGDDPHNALLEDRHAGLVWNALWAQALVERLREAFQLPLTPIANDELAQFLQPLVKP
ncbi:MAG: hypothetical protein KKC79_04755 [Gammaproteobacteria bacterium]|nr:hypothetical protein [Gammaproteobacteria bacterium]